MTRTFERKSREDSGQEYTQYIIAVAHRSDSVMSINAMNRFFPLLGSARYTNTDKKIKNTDEIRLNTAKMCQ